MGEEQLYSHIILGLNLHLFLEHCVNCEEIYSITVHKKNTPEFKTHVD